MIGAALIARARDADIVAAAETLGANLKRISSTERAGPCLVCNGTDRFSVNLKKRLWNCRGCSRGGDVVALVQHMRGIDFREAVAFLTGDEARPAPQAPRPAVRPGAEKGDAFVERLIAGIVRELVPPRGTPGEQYLAEARKIDTDAITDVIERTDAIGWHPSVLFREPGHSLDGRRLGAIVGIMTDPVTAKPTGAISRTYLAPDLSKVGKAKTLGSPAGIVRLSRDEDVLLGIHLVEGLEMGVDAMAKGFRPVWACGSAALMAAFPLLSGVETLTLFSDNDVSGTGLRAATEAAARWRVAGRETHVYQREITGDLNDAFRETER